MPHAELRNRSKFAFESLVLADEEGVPQYVALMQATYAFSADGTLALLEEQPKPNLGGEWYGDPAATSLKYEPQMAFVKPATDIVLLGHAYAPQAGATEVQVGIMVGPVRKLARAVGDRRLVSRLGVSSVSSPEPFEKLPLIYERAFGGWDRSNADPEKHSYEMRNPVGVGFRRDAWSAEDELALPNIEYTEQPFRTYGDTPAPAGFGFIGASWQPRLAFAGTYDATWNRSRKPLLPADFDRRFFNAASAGLVAPGHLRGDEPVGLLGVVPTGRLGFHLPGIAPPQCTVSVRARRSAALKTYLDTVIVDTDLNRLTLLWRAHAPLRNGPHDVVAVDLAGDVPALVRR